MLAGLVSAAAALADSAGGGGEGGGKPGKSGRDDPDGGNGDGRGGIPAAYHALYKKAAAGSCVNWRVLAAIGYVESRHGADTGPSPAGALGPMQFMPATWRNYGRDGNGDGRENVHDPADAIPAAAGYLCAHGAATDLRTALWHYNHSWRYVDHVLAVADRLR
ncbi:lytic transglycosylase domain-containing protein [Actinomadura sp. NBRC 104412]|uniref:lytic transglycosylase domain-containing protein n=1 Tax=Actinomadura sp. NBRC 104412 TaxID=3032203 RepID=UPI0025524100|nr:lytic transglycosylase domain-containing protein [Actinomadura sp. NBRC 104412]